jgi:glutaminase
MINAGAILVCALLKTVAGPEMTLAEKFDYTLNYFVVSVVVTVGL